MALLQEHPPGQLNISIKTCLTFNHPLDQLLAWLVYVNDSPLLL
jgi:hypothetical protein